MANYRFMEVIEGGLCIAVDVGNNASENRWILTRLRAKL